MTAALPVTLATPTPEIVGATGVFNTDTLTQADVVRFPAASRATAVTPCAPSIASAVFQLIVYGAAVTSAPRFTSSTLNCTPTTPVSSAASAEMVIVPLTFAPAAGAVRV